MSYLLRAFGHVVIEAADGPRGIDAARRELPELILCDVQLPGIDGCEVARRLKGDPSVGSIPLIAVTAMAMVGDRERVLSSGFDGYVSKPIDPATFVQQVLSIARDARKAPGAG
jgi:two-component system cell cycle response regulator